MKGVMRQSIVIRKVERSFFFSLHEPEAEKDAYLSWQLSKRNHGICH
jgi:hypothetical protein